MRNKIYKFLLPVYSVICLLILIGIAYVGCDFSRFESKTARFFATLVLCALGGLVGGVIHYFLHESGHLIPLIKRAVILEFSVLFLSFTKKKKGYEISFKRSGYGGQVVFVGKNPETAGALVFGSCLFAWLATLITLTIFAFLFYFANHYVWYCLSGGATLATFYSLLVNFLSVMPSSDGIILFNPKKHVDRIFAVCETESRLYLGESFSEMPEELFYSDENNVNHYYSYLRLMETGDLNSAKKMLEIATAENEKTLDYQPIALDLEKFYLALIFDDEDVVKLSEDKVVAFCDKFVSPTTLRVMIKYCAKRGEIQWESVLRTTFDKQSETALKGLFKAEKTICDKFS